MFLGSELSHDGSISVFERLYIKIFGIPINGLRIRARRVLPLVSDKYKTILDAGCGQGVFSLTLASRYPQSTITGIDFNNELLKRNRKIAKKIGLQNCLFVYQDISKLTLDETYDLILSIDNLEYIPDDQQALKSLYSVLKKGGELIVHVPGLYRRWLIFGWAQNFYIPDHLVPGYTKESIENKIKQAGFAVFESYYTYGWIETITNNISYWITKGDMKNKLLYAVIFPFLLCISYFGRYSKPKLGAGVLVRARK